MLVLLKTLVTKDQENFNLYEQDSKKRGVLEL
jgi:hypothetical protein